MTAAAKDSVKKAEGETKKDLKDLLSPIYTPYNIYMKDVVYQKQAKDIAFTSVERTGLQSLDVNTYTTIMAQLKNVLTKPTIQRFGYRDFAEFQNDRENGFPALVLKDDENQKLRDVLQSKRKLQRIIRPIRVNEVDIWMAVSEFQKGVYTNLKKGETWDRFDKDLNNKKDFPNKANQRRYIAYAVSVI